MPERLERTHFSSYDNGGSEIPGFRMDKSTDIVSKYLPYLHNSFRLGVAVEVAPFLLHRKRWKMSLLEEKRIETVTMKVRDIRTGFGNPRKIGKKEAEELEESLEKYGDFGLFLIDEHDNIIAGNQRLAILQRKDGDIEVLCKRLIGYTKSELRAINIKDNTHSGEWDLEELAKWTADLNIDLGVKLNNKDQTEKTIKEMELIRYEKYDYVLLVCRNELDYNELVRKLGIEGAKVSMGRNRTIKGRAIWYDQIKGQIIEGGGVNAGNKYETPVQPEAEDMAGEA